MHVVWQHHSKTMHAFSKSLKRSGVYLMQRFGPRHLQVCFNLRPLVPEVLKGPFKVPG